MSQPIRRLVLVVREYSVVINTSNVEISKIYNIFFWLNVFLKLIFFSVVFHLVLNLFSGGQVPWLVSVVTVAIVLFPTEL